MPQLRTTVGQLLVNEALPEDMRDYGRVVDKKGMAELFRTLAQRYPERYAEVSKKLADVGRHVATEAGGYSFGPEHMRKAKAAEKISGEIQHKLERILDDDSLSDAKRRDLIVRTVGAYQQRQIDEVFEESLKEKNPLAYQIMSGSRGNKMNLNSLRGSDLLYSDHHDNVIPLPVLRSYSQGLTPAEYWAGTYGARKGVMATKFATQDAGFLSKQLNQVSHRLIVTGLDDPHRDAATPRGLPVDVDDPDSEGALLAKDFAPYKAHTVLSPKILKDLKRHGHTRLLVRSPLVGGSPEGGVYSYDVGVREKGLLPGRGESVGLLAAQALSEPLSQAQLAAKHSGGVAGQEKAVGGFHAINQQIQVPATFQGGAAHAQVDGHVDRVEEAPQGGHYVSIEGEKHYVGHGYGLHVKRGDTVEAGDVISEGWPNPWEIVHHKGIGEGRRYFVNTMLQAYKSAGLKVNRRNLELLSRGLINHVRLTDETDHHAPDDVVPYSTLEHTYEPREGAQEGHPKRLLGHFLEKPVLHYSIGTKIRPSVLKDLEHFGVDKVVAHPEPPPFQAEMVRGMASLHHDPDWVTRMYGSGLKGSLLDAVHHGAISDERGTSFVPGLARAVDFGRVGLVHPPEPGLKPEEIKPPARISPTAHDAPKPHKPKDKPLQPPAWMKLFKFAREKQATVPVSGAPQPPSGPVPGQPGRPRPATPPQAGPRPPAAAPSPPGQNPYNPAHDYVAGTASMNLPQGQQQPGQPYTPQQETSLWQQRQQQQWQQQMRVHSALNRLTGMPPPGYGSEPSYGGGYPGYGGGPGYGGYPGYPQQQFGGLPEGMGGGPSPPAPGQPQAQPGQQPAQPGRNWFMSGLNTVETVGNMAPLAGLGLQGSGLGSRGLGAGARWLGLTNTAAGLNRFGNAAGRFGNAVGRYAGPVTIGLDALSGVRAAFGGDVAGWNETAEEARARGGHVQVSGPLGARLDVNPDASGFERFALQAARNQLQRNSDLAGTLDWRRENWRGVLDNPLSRGGIAALETATSHLNPVSNVASIYANSRQIATDLNATRQLLAQSAQTTAQNRAMAGPSNRMRAQTVANYEARLRRGEQLTPSQMQDYQNQAIMNRLTPLQQELWERRRDPGAMLMHVGSQVLHNPGDVLREAAPGLLQLIPGVSLLSRNNSGASAGGGIGGMANLRNSLMAGALGAVRGSGSPPTPQTTQLPAGPGQLQATVTRYPGVGGSQASQ